MVDLGGSPLLISGYLRRPARPRHHPRSALVAADHLPRGENRLVDSAFGGNLVEWAKRFLSLTIKVVSDPRASAFVALPRRGVVERTISWLLRARRNARDQEWLPAHSVLT